MSAPAAGASGTETQTPTPGMSRAEIEQLVRGIVGNGKDNADVVKTITDNFQQREEIRVLKAEVAGLKLKIPADGSLVLTADQKKEWEQITAAGKPVAEILKLVGEHPTLTAQVESYRRSEELGKLAKSEEYDAEGAVEVLKTIVGNRELVFENVQEDEDDPDAEGGKKKVTRERGFFVIEDPVTKSKSKKRASEVIATDHKAFVAALKASGAGDGEGVEEEQGAAPARPGVSFPKQGAMSSKGAGSAASGKSAAKNYLSRTYKKKQS